MRAVCRKLAKTNGDDDMAERIDDRSVGKDEMTRYIKNGDNCQKITSASKMKEYLETIELMLIEDFEEFKRGCDNQLNEMSSDEWKDRRKSLESIVLYRKKGGADVRFISEFNDCESSTICISFVFVEDAFYAARLHMTI